MKTCLAFGIIADVQYADKETAENRNYRQAINKLAACVDDFNSSQLDFVIQLGDIIDGPDAGCRDMEDALGVFGGCRADTYSIVGNHDFVGANREEVLSLLGLERSYYDFERNGWRFVVLDTTEIGVQSGLAKGNRNYQIGEDMLARLEEQNAVNAKCYNGAVSDEQKRWLKEVLRDASAKGQKAIVFGHGSLLPKSKFMVLNCDDVIEIFEGSGSVVAYFNGHVHSDMYAFSKGIHYFTINAMVEDVEDNAYAVVEIENKQIRVNGKGTVGSRKISLCR
ncbi:MAG: hypothetical protein FVQ79_08660 [Planctomycetes bacterium]|nr:hypothetical protein [Planctomycetota bacterium]